MASDYRRDTQYERGRESRANPPMNLKECLDIVHDLATGNMIDWDMAEEDDGLMTERDRQMEAIGRIVYHVKMSV